MDHAITVRDLLLIVAIPGILLALAYGVLLFFASMMSDAN